jgi:ATP-binding cassette subfamily B protein
MRTLLNYLKPYKWLVALAMFLSAVNMVFSLFEPMIFGKIIDLFGSKASTMSKQEYLNGITHWLLLGVGAAMVSRIAKAFQDYFLNVIVQKFGAKIFTDGLKQAMGLPFQEFEDQRSGETLSILEKVRNDTERFILYFINILFPTVTGIVFVIWYATSKHWALAPVYFGGIIVIGFLTSLLSKKIKTIQRIIVKETTTLAGSTTESLRNIEIVKSLGLTQQEIERINRNTYKILGLELKKVKKVRSISFIQGTVINLLRTTILFLLLYFIFQGNLSVGDFVAMQIYSFFIFGPLQELGNVIMAYREAEASLQNFSNLMSKSPEPEPEKPIPLDGIHTLSYKNVSFQHQTANFKALDNISFEVKKGETIAFVGPSGSGKTTLVKLLLGLYRPQEGTIEYNHLNGADIAFTQLRSQIGFVSQDTQLFAGTIRENLLFVQPQATEAEMLNAMQQASCMNLLQRAENGLDSLIGEGGMKISGGEKQRLSIARALLRNPNLLIFDEATSALDSITEEEINQTIQKVSSQNNQISILIAHRLSTIMHAHKIYVLEKGKIIETGTHKSLLEEKGLYYAMWRQQIGERLETLATTM